MSYKEQNICSFCRQSKPVLRKYVHAGNKELDDNKQHTFVIVYYCQDCGIEDECAISFEKGKEEYIKSVLLDFHKSRLENAPGYDFFFKLSTDLDDLQTLKNKQP